MNEKKDICINDELTAKSYWLDSTSETNYKTLDKDINVDVVIVGGGITGITTALLLKNEGFKIALIEADKIAQGTTGHTTAYVTSQHDIMYSKLISNMGIQKAKQYADANEGAIGFIEDMVKKYNIDCDFVRLPAYIYTTDASYVDIMREEVESAKSLGIKAKYIENLDLPFSVKGALCFENQAQFHPRKYLLKIAENIVGNDSQIYEHTRAVDIKHDDLYTVITDTGFKVIAPKVVIASHFPFYDGLGLYFSRLRPERSYVITAKIKDDLPKGTFVDAGEGGWYFRTQNYRDGKMIIIGGQDHKTAHGGDMMKRYVNLKEFAIKNFNVEKFLYRWSTQDYITIDGVPYVGKLTSKSENIYVATGYGEWGMTNGTAAAGILRDLIINKESPYEEVYNPSRHTSSDGIKNFVKENVDVTVQLIKGKFNAGENDFHLENDQGKIVEIDGDRYGAYRDKNGELHIVDITCTHLGCELKWNSAEASWDCPCHGSRFTFEGDIIEGPAVTRLNHYKEGSNTIDPNLI
jgi:glycine/D-amino acid oxidase-like deaminating enzyme/nitrite reductase/ring-hydroxylating ferredoxin subunit